MVELYRHGTIQVSYDVYSDFMTYKSGIYKHVTGDEVGGHAVALTGWGIENGVKYWKIKNNWNEHWGEKGYFRIVRGENECGIEDYGVAGEGFYYSKKDE